MDPPRDAAGSHLCQVSGAARLPAGRLVPSLPHIKAPPLQLTVTPSSEPEGSPSLRGSGLRVSSPKPTP